MVTKTITLPIPSNKLSPNKSPNKFEKARLVREARTHARRETYDAINSWGLPPGMFIVESLQYVAYWKTRNHKRDDTNLIGSCKHYEDGIQDAVGQDDSTWSVLKPEHYVSKHNPRLVIKINIIAL